MSTSKKVQKKAAVKKTAETKTVAKAPAPKKAPRTAVAATKAKAPAPKKAAARKSSSSSASVGRTTTVIAEVDIGWGNTLFLRGQGGGLSWESGVPMDVLDGVWRWTGQTAAEGLLFKVLINDEHWCHGEDMYAAAGHTVNIHPQF